MTLRDLLCRIALGCCWLLVAGCVSSVPQTDNSIDQFIASQSAAAAKLEQQGHLYQSLVYWQTVVHVAQDNSAAVANSRRLRKQIDQRVKLRMEEADRLMDKGRLRQASVAYLQVLALAPAQERALKQLKYIDAQKVNRQQSAKSMAENQARELLQTGVTEAMLKDFKSLLAAARYRVFVQQAAQYPRAVQHAEFRQLKTTALLNLSRQLERSGQSEQALDYLRQADELSAGRSAEVRSQMQVLSERLSEQFAAQGAGLIARDPQQAIEKLQQAISYNPHNVVAQQQLQRAMKIQENLQKLRARQAN